MNANAFRVLLAESSASEAAASLRTAYGEPGKRLELSTVSTIPTLLATIEIAAPEVIFLDLSLGGHDPIDAVRRVRRAAPGIPLIVFADVADKNFASRSISEGAIDYLLKGFMDTRTMERVLRTALERNTLEGLADLLRDHLTGLYNRDGFMTLGTRSLENAMRSGGTLILLCALIENFSRLQKDQDTSGPEQIVRDMAELLGQCFRRSDFLARIGESQFAALAVDAAEPSAMVLRQRVESHLAIYNQSQHPRTPLTLRLGMGYWGANDPRTFSEFLDAVESGLRQPQGKPPVTQVVPV
jgi:diguanylate cyclase (GGDEF)-like protein